MQTLPQQNLKPYFQDKWSKGIVDWVEKDTAYISVVFTWHLPKAYSLCVFYARQGYRVRAGGVAVGLFPDYLNQVAETNGEVDALSRHNHLATFTSRGCIRRCNFCAVPIIEGEFRELRTWQPKPMICDNNFLVSSNRHFDKVIDSLKPIKGVDFNQGLDARLLTDHHLTRLRELDLSCLRFAWDNVANEKQIMTALNKTLSAGFPKSKLRIYVLVNYKDTFDDAMYRCMTLKEMGILPFAQRYQPLDTLIKNSYISPNWNEQQLIDFCRYWNKQTWLSAIPFEEYRGQRKAARRCSQEVMELGL